MKCCVKHCEDVKFVPSMIMIAFQRVEFCVT